MEERIEPGAHEADSSMNRAIWQMDEKNTALAGDRDIFSPAAEANRGPMRSLRPTFIAPARVSKDFQRGGVEEATSGAKAEERPISRARACGA